MDFEGPLRSEVTEGMCVFEMQFYGCYECNVLCIVELYFGSVLVQYVDVGLLCII